MIAYNNKIKIYTSFIFSLNLFYKISEMHKKRLLYVCMVLTCNY